MRSATPIGGSRREGLVRGQVVKISKAEEAEQRLSTTSERSEANTSGDGEDNALLERNHKLQRRALLQDGLYMALRVVSPVYGGERRTELMERLIRNMDALEADVEDSAEPKRAGGESGRETNERREGAGRAARERGTVGDRQDEPGGVRDAENDGTDVEGEDVEEVDE